MMQVQVEDALPDPPDEFCETHVSHGPTMFMEAGEEVAARHEALVSALRVTVEVGLPEGCVAELEEIVLGECFDAFRRALMGETPARVAPMRVTLKQGADLSQVKAKPRVYPPEKSAWLKEHFELLCETGMVYPNPQAICASVAMAFPKGPGKGYRLVAVFSPSTASASWCRGRCGTLRLRVRNVLAPWLFVLWTAFMVTGSARWRRRRVNISRS